jgi:hypothetical protein
MKKTDFFSVAIVVIGLWCCFQAIIFLVYDLFYLYVFLTEPGLSFDRFLTRDILLTVGYILMAWVALRRTDWVMKALHIGQADKTEEFLEKEISAVPSQGLQKSDVLYIVLVGVGLLLLIPAISELLENIYRGFESKVSRDILEPQGISIFVPIIKVLLPLLVVVSAKRLSVKF